MSVVVKGAFVSGTAAVLATGTYFVAKSIGGMPNHQTITSSSLSSYESKLGKDYRHILVDAQQEGNRAWWEWSYKRLKDNSKGESAEFGEGKIEKGFDKSNDKALNKVCETIYKKNSTDVSFDASTNEENKHKLGRDLLKYCSPLGQKPKSIQDTDGYATDKIGGGNDKTSLASAKAPENDRFWSAMQKHLTANKPTDEFFKRIDNQTIQTLCEEAYKTTSNNTPSSTQPKLDDVKKHCALAKLTS